MIRTLLAGLAVGLGGLLYWQWAGWPPPPLPGGGGVSPQAVDVPATEVSDPIADLKPLEDREEYAVVRERPLFRPDRRPAKEEPTEAVEAPPVKESDLGGFDLTGIIISPGETTAWVKDPQQQTPVRLRPGETLAGWTVTDIRADRLVVERQGKSDTLYLRDFKAPAAPGSAPPPAAPRSAPPPAAARPPTATGKRPPAGGGKKPGTSAGGKSPTPDHASGPGGQPPPARITPPPTASRPGAKNSAAKDPKARPRPPTGTTQSSADDRPPTENPN
jgi:hypothetical protein